MSAFNSVWQNSHASLRYHLGCEKEKALCCLRTEGAGGVECGRAGEGPVGAALSTNDL